MKNNGNGPDWLSWGIGVVSGVALWQVVKSTALSNPESKLPPPIQSLPAVASPARFANLESVSIRIDQVRNLFRTGQMGAGKTVAEAEGLAAAANAFSASRGEDVTPVYGKALALAEEARQSILMS